MSNAAMGRRDGRADGSARQVLVVGAGPVGLVAACELARQGVVPRLIDTLAEPTTQYRAVGVQSRSQEMLANLGVLDQIRDLSLPQVAIEIGKARSDGWQTLTRLDFTTLPTRYPTILNLPQTDTEAVLRDRAAELGVTVERGVTLTGLDMDSTGADVALATPTGVEEARFDWIVGADGGHSSVRKAVGSKLEGRFRGSHFIVADVSVESQFPADTTRLFADPGGLTVMMCMRANRTRLLFQIPTPGANATAPTFEHLERLAAQRMGGNVRVYDPQWLSYYSIHHAQVPQYRIGRALLAGDAAHVHSPAGGQGMNTGMQDAANLGWKLALVCCGVADPSLMDSYHAERHPVGSGVVRRTTLMANGMTLSGPAAGARNALVKTVSRIEPLTRAMAATIAEVTVTYPRSPLNAAAKGRRPRGPLAAGSYAPDVPGLTDGDGVPLAIGELLQQPGYLLLALTGSADRVKHLREIVGPLGRVVPVLARRAAGSSTVIVDADGAIGRRYGLFPDGLALIRPDGYVGYLSRITDPHAVQHYLTTGLRARGSGPELTAANRHRTTGSREQALHQQIG